jgi:ComEC/Rec2-related protein
MITQHLKQFFNKPAIPSLPLLLAYTTTTLPLIWGHLYHFNYLTVLIWIPVYFIYKFTDSERHLIILFSLLGLLSSFLCTFTPSNHLTQITTEANKYCTIKGTIINVHYPSKILQWKEQKNKYIIEASQIETDQGWKNCSGKIILDKTDENYTFGDELVIKGALRRISQPQTDNIFSYSLYLKTNSISHRLRVDTANKHSPASGYRRILLGLYTIRDHLIARAVKGLGKDKHRRIIASIFFGYKGLLTPQERDTFQKSGTAHLFAVSGLHIGIAASFIYFLLSFFRMSRLKTSLLLLGCMSLYLLMTGAPPSAVRAFVMLSVWMTARAFLLPSTGLNNLSLAALILLIFNPMNLFSIGFLYTFIITTSLVLAYEKSLSIFHDLNEKKIWKGKSFTSLPIVYKIHILFFCSVTASLSSWGLNILFNQQVIPLAFFTNLFTSTLAFFCFILASLSFSELSLIYSLQEVCLSLLDFVCTKGAIFWKTGDISILAITLYYILFFKNLTAPKKSTYILGATVLIFIFISWPRPENRLEIYTTASSNIPTINIFYSGKTYLINCTSNEAMKSHINQNIDLLLFSDAKADHMWGLKSILEMANIDSIQLTEKPSFYLKRKLQKNKLLAKQKKVIHISASLQRLDRHNYHFAFADTVPGNEKLQIDIQREKYGRCSIYIQLGPFKQRVECQFQNKNSRKIIHLPY